MVISKTMGGVSQSEAKQNVTNTNWTILSLTWHYRHLFGQSD